MMVKAILRKIQSLIRERKMRDDIREKGGYCDNNVRFSVQGGGNFVVGKHVTILGHGIDLNTGSRIIVCNNAEINIGDYTGMSQVSLYSKEKIQIGNHCTIGAGVMIFDTDFHNLDWRKRRGNNDNASAKSASINIGDDVFIGTRSIICKGVTIGDHSVIGANSVVTRSIPADEVWAGNPAKFIRKLEYKDEYNNF